MSWDGSQRRRIAATLWVCALAVVVTAGCTSWRTNIDPSGQHLFNPPPPAPAPVANTPVANAPASDFRVYPGGPLPWDNTQVIVTPAESIAPVGSDVVILAGVKGPDAYLRTNEKVEWTIAPGSVGHLVDHGKGLWRDFLVGDFTWPRKLAPDWAVTSTSRLYLRLNSETPTPDDDVNVLRGQTWVSLTSPVEGTSHVTAFAPSVYGWPARKKTAVVHWIDAAYGFPAPAICPAGGQHVFRTTVTRQTDGTTPRAGWVVRYEITGGPPAGFLTDGGQVAEARAVEVVTDANGQAAATIVQREAKPGTSCVRVQVIRPAGIDGTNSKRLVASTGSTTATWSAPELSIRKIGPPAVGSESELVYRIEISNQGDLPADNVQVTDEIPAGMTYISSSPAPVEQTSQMIRWDLGRLDARQVRPLEVRLRTGAAGSVTSCAEATATGGLRTRGCVTTTIGAAALALDIRGRTTAQVGDRVDFQILITNRGQVTATGLKIRDSFDDGLVHDAAASPIKKMLGDLPPGQTIPVDISFRVTKSGELCHEVEVTGNGGILVTGRGCVTATATSMPSDVPGTPPAAGRAAISATLTGPQTAELGKSVLLKATVRNTGQVPLTGVEVVASFDMSVLKLIGVSQGHNVSDNQVAWKVQPLQPNEGVVLELDFECNVPTAGTPIRVQTRANQAVEDKKEFTLRVGDAGAAPPTGPSGVPPTTLPAAPPGGTPGLTLSMFDFTDPVALGARAQYEIKVTNGLFGPDKDVKLVVTFPPGMTPSQAGTSGPSGVGGFRISEDRQSVEFDSVAEVRPGDNLVYTIWADTAQLSHNTIQAHVTSQNHPAGLTREETTDVVSP
ncbi:MAG: DUF11 domain-containing protein [Pirellulales bacterium]|nr:DUF11 domain-containing protein [Pirellulales bacterium]